MALNCEETIDSNSTVVVKYVYNLDGSSEEIKVTEDFHTYFVGEYGVLVKVNYYAY